MTATLSVSQENVHVLALLKTNHVRLGELGELRVLGVKQILAIDRTIGDTVNSPW